MALNIPKAMWPKLLDFITTITSATLDQALRLAVDTFHKNMSNNCIMAKPFLNSFRAEKNIINILFF